MFALLTATAANLMTLPVLQAGTLTPDFKVEFDEGVGAAVQVRLVVSPEGNPVRCDPRFVNGPKSNADAFCSMILSRTKFSPARDDEGQPAYGVIYLWSHWNDQHWRGSYMPSWNPPNLALATNKMPKGLPEGSLFVLQLQATSEGRIGRQCAVLAGANPVGQFADLLCREAGTQRVTPAMDQRGNAVPSVQQFVVRIVSQPLVDNLVKHLRQQ